MSFGSFSYWPAAAGVGVLAYALVQAGRRRPGDQRAMLTGIAAGLVFGNPAVARATRWAHAAYWPAVVAPALGCVYALAVLVAFRTPAIRDFYRRSN